MKMTALVKLMRKKIKDVSGESISEVLVAALVISLASIMMATMISTSVKIIDNAQKEYFAQVDENYIFVTGRLDVLDDTDKLIVVANGANSVEFNPQYAEVKK